MINSYVHQTVFGESNCFTAKSKQYKTANCGRFFSFRRLIFFCLTVFITPVLIASLLSRPAHAFSVGEEREAGKKMMSVVRQEFKLINDPDVLQYINNLGTEVLQVAGPQFFDYKFFVIDNKEFNAFAAPSGLVFIHSGLMESMENEDELIGVLAHECAHVSNRHIADRIAKAAKINMGTVAMIMAGIAMGGGPLSEAIVTGALATDATMNLKFSRENEEEADRMAFTWMKSMQRDPWAMLSMLQKMRRISILKMGKVPQYLLTHPDPAYRMGYVQDLLSNSNTPKSSRENKDFDFLRIRYRILSISKAPSDIMPRLRRLIREDKDPTSMARYGLSLATLEEGNFSEAEKYLQQVIERYRNKPILLSDMAVIQMRQGNFAKAKILLNKASEADRTNAYISYNLALVLMHEKEIDRAIELFKQLSREIPAFGRLHYHLSQAYATKGMMGESHYHTGVWSFYEGNPKKARYHLEEAKKKLDGNDPLQEKIRETLKNVKEFEKM